MATETMITKTIDHLTRLNNSVNGNPRWKVTCTDGLELTTAPDVQRAYGLDGSDFRDVPVTFTLRKGLVCEATPAAR